MLLRFKNEFGLEIWEFPDSTYTLSMCAGFPRKKLSYIRYGVDPDVKSHTLTLPEAKKVAEQLDYQYDLCIRKQANFAMGDMPKKN